MESGTSRADKPSQRSAGADPLDVTETFWGYIIAPGGRSSLRANMGEVIATIAAMAFLGAGFSLWLLPAANSDPALLPFKIGLTAVFFLGCGVFYSMAKKGMRFECQVDLHERVIRLVRRNRGDESIALFSSAFVDIEALELRRAKLGFLDAELAAKPRHTAERQIIAKGPAPMLEILAQKLNREIEAAKQSAAQHRPAHAANFDQMARSSRAIGG